MTTDPANDNTLDENLYLGEISTRKPLVAFTLNLICPGLGNVYVGQLLRGILITLLFISSLGAFIALWTAEKFFPLLPALVFFIGWFIFAYNLAHNVAMKAHKEGKNYVLKSFNEPMIYYALLLGLLIFPFLGLIQYTRNQLWGFVWIASDSMYPTLGEGDLLLIDRTAYNEHLPEVGDIVIFSEIDSTNAPLSVGRIIAIPGDTISVNEAIPSINGTPLNRIIISENLLLEASVPLPVIQPIDEFGGSWNTWGESFEGMDSVSYLTSENHYVMGSNWSPHLLSPDNYFLLHDNRSRIGDSRERGPIHSDMILGRALFIAFSSTEYGVHWDRIARRI
jgi:signal peptidase I